MNYIWKKTLKSLSITIILLLILSFIGNIFYYFDIFSNITMKYFEMLIVILSTFIGGFILGKNASSKGYLHGITLSIIINLIFIILGLILHNLYFSNIIYYFIVTICTTIGSMLGIMKKTK